MSVRDGGGGYNQHDWTIAILRGHDLFYHTHTGGPKVVTPTLQLIAASLIM